MSASAAGIPPVGSKELAAIMSKNDKWPYSATSDSVILIHSAFRADMADLLVALERLAAQAEAGRKLEAWEVKILQAFYRMFHTQVHLHHDHEEELFFPWLSTRIQLPDKLAADHKTLVQMLDDCLKVIMSLKAGEVQAAQLTVLRDTFAKLKVEMEEHLAEEEEVTIPLMRMHFSYKEFVPMEEKILKNVMKELGFGGFVQTAAHGFRTCTEEERIEWMTQVGQMPFLVRKLVLLPACRRFDRDFLSKVECLKRGEPPAHKRGPFACFAA